MNIPNDTGHPFRLRKFVEYQHAVPAIDPLTIQEFARRRKVTADDKVWLAWLNSVTYCEVTVPFLYEQIDWSTVTSKQLEQFWFRNKPKLIFNSARRYAKNMDWFVSLLTEFLSVTQREPYNWLRSLLEKNAERNYANVYQRALQFRFTGRFAAERFLVTLIPLFPQIDFSPSHDLDWQNRSNLTSGLFNVFYRDEEANMFDYEVKRITTDQEDWLNRKLVEVQRAIQKTYPQQESSLPLVETKLCSFRNLFKGSRYGGYHHDRQLENLLAYERAYPGLPLWDEIRKIRCKLFAPHLLGEIGGWTGIRKERKKLWLTVGQTGVEKL
jgi:hypothetical protein